MFYLQTNYADEVFLFHFKNCCAKNGWMVIHTFHFIPFICIFLSFSFSFLTHFFHTLQVLCFSLILILLWKVLCGGSDIINQEET